MMKWLNMVLICASAAICLALPGPVLAESTYVGTAACADCHQEQHDKFIKYSKKAHSAKSIKVMASDLTDQELSECYGCHATGYGKPGGFVSVEKKRRNWPTLDVRFVMALAVPMLKAVEMHP